MLSPDEIRANVESVNARIATACANSARRREDVRLVAVTKTFPAEAIDYGASAGITDVGENRVQEARDKQALAHGNVRWHLIGHLQLGSRFRNVETMDANRSGADAVPKCPVRSKR